MKPNSFTKLYVHIVFSPKGRASLLNGSVKDYVHKYIYGIIKEKKCYPIAINGTADHIHLLIGMNPSISISDLVRDIKRSSALFINSNRLTVNTFNWQEGYGAFTVGSRELDKVYKYILNQEVHHSTIHFKDEYREILRDEDFENFEEFLFEFYES